MLAIAMIVARSNSSRVRVRHSGNFQKAVTCVNQLSRRSFANRFREGQGAPFDRTGIFQFTLFNALTEPILLHGLGGVDLSQGLIPAVPGEMSETQADAATLFVIQALDGRFEFVGISLPDTPFRAVLNVVNTEESVPIVSLEGPVRAQIQYLCQVLPAELV